MKFWEQRVALAEHYIAVDQAEQFLWRDDDLNAFPWELVTVMEVTGGGTRTSIGDTTIFMQSIKFTAPHPSGLTFTWTLDIGVNGDCVRVRQDVLLQVPGLLPNEALRRQFLDYIAEYATAVQAATLKSMAYLDELLVATAATLTVATAGHGQPADG